MKNKIRLERSRFLLTQILPAVALTLLVGFGVLGLLLWSSHTTDHASRDRQSRLVELVVSKLREAAAHDQESVTVWDDAVEQVRLNDTEWIDINLGAWMGDYFGFDGAYVLDPRDQPIYAYTNGGRASPEAFEAIAPEVVPLVDALRSKMRAGDVSQVNEMVLSPGVADLAVIRSRPAIVTVKPIVSDTGNIEQIPGEEYVHVLVRFVDGNLVEELQTDYMFENLYFSWVAANERGLSSQPLKSDGGATIGYFVWHPYKPGYVIISKVVPVLTAVIVLALILVVTFLALNRKRSKRLAASEERIRYLALHDSLTGLPNRTSFNDRVDEALAEAGNSGISLLYLDLDRFKQVNDTLGHSAGDALIYEFGRRLAALVGEDDIVARFGGDEFALMLRNYADCDEMEGICQAIIDEARRPFDIGGNKVFVGVSVGASVAQVDGMDRTELLRKADVALYYSKTTGRGRYSFFSQAMDQALKLRQHTETDLRKALSEEGQLLVYYQPILSSESHKTVGYEALLRWRHPENGWISPELFIPIAEDTGLISQIGTLVMREACIAAAAWSEMTVAVNVSAVELGDPDYAARVRSILEDAGLEARRLELEITESAATDENSIAGDNLRSLRNMGVRIAIDDFGTGFSSLGRLHSLNVDRIKIDKSFVQGLGPRSDDEAIIRAIVDLAHAKGLKTTAEGVETKAQEERLARIGCDDLQGFLYSVAIPIWEVNRSLVFGAKEQDLSSQTS